MQDVAKNMNRKNAKGCRWSEATKQLFVGLKLSGGQRIPRMLALNVAGPSIETVKRYNRKIVDKIYPGRESLTNFEALAKRWKVLLEQRRKTHPETTSILCELSEDETGNLPLPEYSFEWDVVLGLCGKSHADHKCDDSYFPKVGDDWDGLVDIMQNSIYSHYTRIIMVNPLCSWLRPAVVHVNSCCNKFDHYPHVSSQWETTEKNFRTTLGPLGFICIGHGSDGDARRFLLQSTESMRARQRLDRIPTDRIGIVPANFTGTIPTALQAPGFTFACLRVYENSKLIGFKGVHSQDSIHKSKRLDGPLQGVKRMVIGRYLASANDLWLVRRRTIADNDHNIKGLRLPDLKRDDRQNFMAVVRRSSNKTRRMLLELQDEHRTQGTHAVYRMLHKYLMLFFSKTESVLKRVEHAGYVCRFLRLWRLQIIHDAELSVQQNFYPNQTFNHVLLSCMSAVMYMIACRDLTPAQLIFLDKLGSDCCEQCYSNAGGWGPTSSWRRNFNFPQFLKKVEDFDCLQQLDASGLFKYKAHTVTKKCEFDHSYHEDTTQPAAVLAVTEATFSNALIVKHWNIGQNLAVQHAIELHMNDNVPDAAWAAPWEHDPRQRDAQQYMRSHPGSDCDDTDTSDASVDDDSDDDGTPDTVGVNSIEEQDEVNFNHAVSLLAQANGAHDSFITIPGNPPTKLSKNTAVIKLRDAFKDSGKISTSRLDRITQLAVSAEQQVDDCAALVGEKN